MFFIIIGRLWKNLQYILCRNREDLSAVSKYIFVQKPWKKMCSWYFLCWRLKKIPNRICQHNRISLGHGSLSQAIIFNTFLSLFWCRASNELTLSIKDVMKNLQYIWCRNRATAFESKMCGQYFFILKIVWLLLETFPCFLKDVRLLLKRY